jgi:hypothetical protein
MANTKIPPELVDDQVFGRRNLIINGDMRVAQRGTSATTLSTNPDTFSADRFRMEQGSVTANNGTIEVATDAPSGTGFTKSFKVTGGSSVSYNSTGFAAINYRGEGDDFNQVLHGTSSAKTVTISFWVKSSVTGTYSLNHTKYDGSQERFNVSEYTISQANTWEYKKVNVAGDTSVSASDWIRLYWQLGGDSGHKTATAGTWINGDGTKRATSSQPDMITTNGATFFLTGVQFEVGDQATPFEYRSIAEELALCQRYCQKYGPYATNSFPFGPSGYSYAATTTAVGQILPAELRTSPSISFNGDGNPELRGGNTAGSNTYSAVTSVSSIVSAGTSLMMNVTTSGLSNETGQVRVLCNASANNFMIYDAEL